MENLNDLDKNFIEKYHPHFSVDNFLNEGLIFTDHNGYSVGLSVSSLRDGILHTKKPYADIMVLGTEDGLILGWVQREKMKDAEDRALVPVKALNKMPHIMKFSQPCPHMSVHGGYYDDDEDNWRCYGCQQVMVFEHR